jgi:large subunit ribosomal protein L23
MLPTQVIRRPLITEKSTYASGETNRYAFEVDRRADKTAIRRAVEALYGVKVTAVTVQNRIGKLRRYRYGYVQSPPTKRAVVRVSAGDRIELF